MNIVPNPEKDDVALFRDMSFQDWPEAKLKDAFDYLYKCKYVRIGVWEFIQYLKFVQVCMQNTYAILILLLTPREDPGRVATGDDKFQSSMGCCD